ncbi:carbonic anhydrase, putative [Phytophthora infestans T30-4]|uniref:carbonic anhydrase n=1 Tax=Phytophthora infestans (strain T30-4) TaxID=403677 RepID=D0NAR9_PHYIT|nr:carbonic anhydrase, putative [Phytophthora infestans T30-4]EEY54927.1 carbonic anhydrase, putative [Phytophthora infestans T30-4]|eukprot:XP_002903872.1 carbonic anhydrase, putative [Phytophthora infestans T30-4]
MGTSVSKVLHHKATIASAIVVQKVKAKPMLSQSPIDIIEDPVMDSVPLNSAENALQLGSASAEIHLVHGGDNFQVNWSNHEQNVLTLNGKKYYTVQFHFHAPTRAMELHLVHQAEDGSLAVVGVFFTEGKENAFLAQFWDEISTLNPKKHDHVALGQIVGGDELNSLLEGRIFRYKGSLTTPPYSEGVEWAVVSDMLEASPEQLERYRNFLPRPNARDAQKLNGRKVSLCQCSNIIPFGA